MPQITVGQPDILGGQLKTVGWWLIKTGRRLVYKYVDSFKFVDVNTEEVPHIYKIISILNLHSTQMKV